MYSELCMTSRILSTKHLNLTISLSTEVFAVIFQSLRAKKGEKHADLTFRSCAVMSKQVDVTKTDKRSRESKITFDSAI